MITENVQKVKSRNFALDVVRVLACLLVVWQHSSELYYIGPHGEVVREHSTYLIGIIDSVARTAVPLFVMISGYFLLPMKDTFTNFFKKRMNRILFPFIFWCIIYAIFGVLTKGDTIQQCLINIARIPVNYGTEVGHLWYVYMLIGLYLLVPILSPWLQSCTKKQLEVYLGIWIFSCFLPYIHLIFPNILGECYWNASPLLYYFYGMVGYFILGFYVKKYGIPKATISTIILIIGYIVTVIIYNSRIATAGSIPSLELSWDYCSVNVGMMTLGIFGLVAKIKYDGQNKLRSLLTGMATHGYGIYLGHIIILTLLSPYIVGKLGSVVFEVPILAITVLILTYIGIRILSFLPKAKWWLGI